MDYKKEGPFASLILHPSANANSKRSSLLERAEGPELAVRPEGANHQWRRVPPG